MLHAIAMGPVLSFANVSAGSIAADHNRLLSTLEAQARVRSPKSFGLIL